MSAQPIWITPPGSLGTVPEGTYYQVPLQVTDTVTIDIIGISGTGTSVTAIFYVWLIEVSGLFPSHTV